MFYYTHEDAIQRLVDSLYLYSDAVVSALKMIGFGTVIGLLLLILLGAITGAMKK